MIQARKSRGYAMALMLVVLLVLTTITVSVVSAAFRDQESSRFVATRSEGRLLTVAALEEFFAHAQRDPERFATGATAHPAVGRWMRLPAGALPGAEPLDLRWSSTVPCAAGPEALLEDCYLLSFPDQVSVNGRVAALTVDVLVRARCAGNEQRCVYTRTQQRLWTQQFVDFSLAQQYSTLAPGALFPAGSFETGGPNRAGFETYQAACVRPASERRTVTLTGVTIRDGFSDAASGTFTEKPASSNPVTGCVDVSYQRDTLGSDDSSDELSLIYNGDDFLTVCNDPSFGKVLVAGPGLDAPTPGAPRRWFRRPPGATGCVAGSARLDSVDATLDYPYLRLPSGDRVVEAAVEAAARPGVTFVEVVKGAPGEPVTVRFTPTKVRICTGPVSCTERDYGNTVILVRDVADSAARRVGSTDVLVSGTVRGLVSVVVEGSAAIDGDLVYAAGAGRLNRDDALSLTATERIEIWQSCPKTGNPASWDSQIASNACTAVTVENLDRPGARRVHAVLTSPDGYVGVPDWRSNSRVPVRTQAPLEFYGAISSKFQGVFGSFSSSTGDLVSGFYKKFTHDCRLSAYLRGVTGDDGCGSVGLPPYLVQTTAPVWVRSAPVEVPVGTVPPVSVG